MEQVKRVLEASLLWRTVNALCLWFGGQWKRSRVVQWFLHPSVWDRSLSEGSVFYRLWSLLRRGLCWLYEKLRLDKLFDGSVFTRCWLWCALPVVFAPLLPDSVHPSLIVAGLAVVGTASLLLNLVRDRKRQLAWSPINRYVILYAAVYMAGTLFSVDLKASLEPGLLSVAFILFSVVLCSAVGNRKQLDVLVDLMVLAAALVSFYGILQYLFRWGYQSAAWVDSDMFSSIQFRVASTLQNPNMLGQYLLLLIPLGGAKLLTAKSWEKRIYCFCCCGVMCLCMILTFSRGAWLGLLFAGVVFFVLLYPRIIPWLILAAPFLAAGMYFVLPETIVSRFTSIGNMNDASTSYRVFIWMGTLAMLKNYWLCGIGPGSEAFNRVYPAYGYNGIIAPHSHNLFLQLVCDAGIAALAVFLIVLFVYFRTMCGALSREKNWDNRVLQIAFTAGVCGFLVQAMTDYSFYNYRVMFLFWAYLALGGLAAQRRELPRGGLLT
ncbi:MAG: O-antigen ligase family protein [Oscillospiraceae bacterium]|nr:O-antigen ligase family protein [Oscillospiraceae bacterium]